VPLTQVSGTIFKLDKLRYFPLSFFEVGSMCLGFLVGLASPPSDTNSAIYLGLSLNPTFPAYI